MVSLTCGYKCLQVILVVFNVLVFACGLGLIVVGSMAQVAVNNYSASVNSTFRAFLIFILILGCVLFLLGFLGFCGACSKNVCALTLYTIMLIVIVCAEIAGGIAGVVLKDKVKQTLIKTLKNAVENYNTNPDIQRILDKIQHEFKCCGVESSSDYPGQVPSSCQESGETFKQGCYTALVKFLQRYLVAVAVCVFLFAIFQTLCIVFAVCVIRAIKRGETA